METIHNIFNEQESIIEKFRSERYQNQYEFKCNQCNQSYPHEYRLELHEKSHFYREKKTRIYNQQEYHESTFADDYTNTNDTIKNKPIRSRGFLPLPFRRPLPLTSPPNPVTFECFICKKQFKMRNYLRNHMKIHIEIREYQCEKCSFASKTRCYLKQHIRYVHEKKKYVHKCNICSRSFIYKYLCDRHVRLKHSNNETFQCFTCGSVFSTEIKLKKHERDIHYSIKKHSCPDCGKLFKYNGYKLTRHMKTHSKR